MSTGLGQSLEWHKEHKIPLVEESFKNYLDAIKDIELKIYLGYKYRRKNIDKYLGFIHSVHECRMTDWTHNKRLFTLFYHGEYVCQYVLDRFEFDQYTRAYNEEKEKEKFDYNRPEFKLMISTKHYHILPKRKIA